MKPIDSAIQEYYETLELANADSDEFTRVNTRLDELIDRLNKSARASVPELNKLVGGKKKK
jgi:tetrahydromethanopterin S-methyltransferase subunit G